MTALFVAAAGCALAAIFPYSSLAPVETAEPAGTPSTTGIPDQQVDADTQFEYIAVFPVGTTAAQIEQWRQKVLIRVHREPCFHGFACLSRLLRLAELGERKQYVLAFDLQSEISPVERAAVLAAAERIEPIPRLVQAQSPRQALFLLAQEVSTP